jgi:hypothetical protein
LLRRCARECPYLQDAVGLDVQRRHNATGWALLAFELLPAAELAAAE